MDKRPIIGIVLIFLTLVLWQSMVFKKTAKTVREKQKTEKIDIAAPESIDITSTEVSGAAFIELKRDSLSKSFIKLDTVTTRLFTIVFNPVGASIVSLKLSQYEDKKGIKGVELIPQGKSGLKDVFTGTDNKKLDFGNVVFQKADCPSNKVIYEIALSTGGTAQKIYTFSDSSYMLELEYKFPDTYLHKVIWNAGLASTEKDSAQELRYFGGVSSLGKTVVPRALQQLDTTPVTGQGNIDWVGVKNKYFLIAIIPLVESESYSMHRFARGNVGGGCVGGCASVPTDPDAQRVGMSLSTKANGNFKYKVYAGPLDYEFLNRMGYNLGEACYFGMKWIRPISRFFLKVFLAFHSVIPNYGVVIMLFSFLMTILFFPLTSISQKSAISMQRMQPKMQELQKKYKGDPKKLNQAVMDLYRKEGVSPFSGCLPVLVQMPVFFALYAVLDSSIVLRNAVFIPHWIESLSSPDPFFILPIAMGVMMFFQQKMQSAQMTDPSQKRMMYFMPIIFTVIFLRFPSGLVIYWFVYNTFSVIETQIIKKKMGLTTVHK